MEPKDWISLAGIVSTLFISLIAIFINDKRELRQEKLREDERQRDHQPKIEEKRFEIRYGKLHEKRVEALSELYERLSHTGQELDAAASLIDLQPSELGHDVAQTSRTACRECARFFAKNRLYFTKQLAGQLDNLLHDLTETSVNIVSYIQINDFDSMKNELTKWSEKRKAVVTALEQIEVEFRNLLGFTT